MISIIFHKSRLDTMFRALGKTTDPDGYLVEKSNPTQRVITPEGEIVKPKDVGIVRPGSQIFIKKDIDSLIKLASDLV